LVELDIFKKPRYAIWSREAKKYHGKKIQKSTNEKNQN